MKYFTYKDYIKCIHTLRLNSIMKLAESLEEYNSKRKDELYLYKILIKNILRNKKHAKEFLNSYLKTQFNIDEKNLEIYTNEHIEKKAKTNIIYKLNNTDIFFVIQCTDVSNNKPIYTLLDNCIDIMRKYCHSRKEADLLRLPVIVPIIIFTGTTNWEISENMDMRYKNSYKTYELDNIELKYNLYQIKNDEKNKEDKDEILVNKVLKISRSNYSSEFVKEIQDSKFKKMLNILGNVGEIEEIVIDNILKNISS